ncbi:helix-turn-helix domain-containing protein [Aliarcobacter cryaerophilus]|uniref:helix-turn-helix transcriptional regulator n=1 Tax=Aliarcobacter cryaerophilus TaxID=28198 RepID=UPI003DA62BFA
MDRINIEDIIPKYLPPKQAAIYLGVSVDLLQKWRTKGIGVPYIKLGESTSSLIRYDREELDKYLKSKTIKTM